MPNTSNSALVDVRRLAQALETFATERDWHQFHSPKNLVMALSGEVGELTEIFQWMSEDASRTAGTDPATATKVQEELADVLLYLVRLGSRILFCLFILQVLEPTQVEQMLLFSLSWADADRFDDGLVQCLHFFEREG